MNMPVSYFSMAVGTLAWGHSWQAASLVWPLPTWLVTVASALGLMLWLALLCTYARKGLRQAQAVRDEFKHPVQSAMTALLPVSTLLAAIMIPCPVPHRMIPNRQSPDATNRAAARPCSG